MNTCHLHSIRCPMCAREVKATRKRRVSSHLSCGAVRCIAVGMDFDQAVTMRRAIDVALPRPTNQRRSAT